MGEKRTFARSRHISYNKGVISNLFFVAKLPKIASESVTDGCATSEGLEITSKNGKT